MTKLHKIIKEIIILEMSYLDRAKEYVQNLHKKMSKKKIFQFIQQNKGVQKEYGLKNLVYALGTIKEGRVLDEFTMDIPIDIKVGDLKQKKVKEKQGQTFEWGGEKFKLLKKKDNKTWKAVKENVKKINETQYKNFWKNLRLTKDETIMLNTAFDHYTNKGRSSSSKSIDNINPEYAKDIVEKTLKRGQITSKGKKTLQSLLKKIEQGLKYDKEAAKEKSMSRYERGLDFENKLNEEATPAGFKKLFSQFKVKSGKNAFDELVKIAKKHKTHSDRFDQEVASIWSGMFPDTNVSFLNSVKQYNITKSKNNEQMSKDFWKYLRNPKNENKLKEIIRQIIKEEYLLNETKSLEKGDVETIKKIIEKIWKTKLPRRKFHNRSIDWDDVDGTEIHIKPGMGIVVLQNLYVIPKFDELVKEFKKYFGNVHSDPKDYINVRDFGDKYKEFEKVENPKNIKQLPKITKNDFKNVKTKKDLVKILDKIREALKNREAKVDFKNIKMKFPIVKKIDVVASIVKYNDNYYVGTSFELYYAKDLKEAQELARIWKTEQNIHRYLEVQSWNVSRMGPEGMLD